MKKTTIILLAIFTLTNTCFTSPLFMTRAEFKRSDMERSAGSDGQIKDLVGVYKPVKCAKIPVFYGDNFYDLGIGILTGINDTDDPDIVLLTFIWRVEDGANYKHDRYDYGGEENLKLLDVGPISFPVNERGFSTHVDSINDSHPIMRYRGEIPEEEIEELEELLWGRPPYRKD